MAGHSALPAQTSVQIQGLQIEDEQSIQHVLGDTLKVSPTMALVDGGTRTVTLALTNMGADTLVVDTIRMQASPPERRPMGANPLLATDSGPAGAQPQVVSPSDSLHPVGSLAAWIQDMPKPFALAPGATQTLSLHLKVPQTLSPGRYAAYLVLHTTPIVNIPLTECLGGICSIQLTDANINKTGRFSFAGAWIVYTAGSAPSGAAGSVNSPR